MLKLLVISHALAQEENQKRWRCLAREFIVQVRVLVPKRWGSTWFGVQSQFVPEKVCDGRFEVVPVATSSENQWWKYQIKGLAKQLREFFPDVIFCIHEEAILQLHQTILFRRLFAQRSRLLYFSMHPFPRVDRLRKVTPRTLAKWFYQQCLWWHVRTGTDGAIVHVPLIADQMRADGYTKPILIQTQIGVDPDVFYPDEQQGIPLRTALGLTGTIIGYAGRLITNKGINVLLEALEELGCLWSLLLVGDGPCREDVEKWALAHGWSDRVHITGYIGVNDVARYMRAMDIFAFGSLVRPDEGYWDMFPLVVAQAMATGLPVVASDGGGAPYQLGGQGLLYPPGDAITLRILLMKLIKDSQLRQQTGNDHLQRATSEFCIPAMNKHFLTFIQQHLALEV